MRLSFLPEYVKSALDNLNYNFLSEIRLRRGQPIIVEYRGEYKYINAFGVTNEKRDLIIAGDLYPILNSATEGCIYKYSEQMKHGFITVQHGVRIGIAGEYITQGNAVQAINNITSLNVRIPHNVVGCAEYLVKNLFSSGLHSTLIYSKPGFGKTTMLRDLVTGIDKLYRINILVFDERGEIAAIDANGNGFELGENVDIVRCYNKFSAIPSAIRAMKPQLIITDELYGDEDIKAVNYCLDCGICVIASSHVTNHTVLSKIPFDFYVELTGIGKQPIIYDKNFNAYSSNSFNDGGGSAAFIG